MGYFDGQECSPSKEQSCGDARPTKSEAGAQPDAVAEFFAFEPAGTSRGRVADPRPITDRGRRTGAPRPVSFVVPGASKR
jgi:hypothetical protein